MTESDTQPIRQLQPIGGMGKGQRVLTDGNEAALFEHDGSGCLNHLWFGGNFEGVEDTRIRYYVDGEATASINMALYLGHGIGFHDQQAPWATQYVGKIGKRNGVFNNYPIPFSKHIRVTAQCGADVDSDPQIWWIIRGLENNRVKLGGHELPESARLKLLRLEDQPVESLAEFNLCDLSGAGAIFKVMIAAKGDPSLNYLEACMRCYLGDDSEPMLLSSGLEDYFLGTYYFDSGKYHSDIAGLTHFDQAAGRFSAYRFHDRDPIIFQNGLRLTCRCGETEHGDTGGQAYLQPTETRYTTYTWAYQW